MDPRLSQQEAIERQWTRHLCTEVCGRNHQCGRGQEYGLGKAGAGAQDGYERESKSVLLLQEEEMKGSTTGQGDGHGYGNGYTWCCKLLECDIKSIVPGPRDAYEIHISPYIYCTGHLPSTRLLVALDSPLVGLPSLLVNLLRLLPSLASPNLHKTHCTFSRLVFVCMSSPIVVNYAGLAWCRER